MKAHTQRRTRLQCEAHIKQATTRAFTTERGLVRAESREFRPSVMPNLKRLQRLCINKSTSFSSTLNVSRFHQLCNHRQQGEPAFHRRKKTSQLPEFQLHFLLGSRRKRSSKEICDVRKKSINQRLPSNRSQHPHQRRNIILEVQWLYNPNVLIYVCFR